MCHEFETVEKSTAITHKNKSWQKSFELTVVFKIRDKLSNNPSKSHRRMEEIAMLE